MASATEVGFRLGIDVGTSHTTAILGWPDGRTRPLLFDGSPLLPSSVYAEQDGPLLVGRDAVHAARLDPVRFEPSPKRRIDRDVVTLGDQAVPVTAMIAALLRRVADEAVRVAGGHVGDLTLTHPAGWTGPRLARLTDACRLAGLPDPAMVAEPVAAAGYFVSVLRRTIPSGSALVVYDFGGGTFDASAVTPSHDGYRVLAMAGLNNLGGVDLDAALLEFIATVHRGQDSGAWQRLEDPQTPADRRHRRHLIEDVRAAKEMLSRASSAAVPVPLLELEARVRREEFDALARPLLERTVATTTEVIRAANLPPERIAAILLVGGSSRIPLVAELLRAATGIDVSTIEEPETVVAEGSLRLASGAPASARATTVPLAAGASVAPAPGPLSPPADPWATPERAAQYAPVPAVPAVPAPILPAPAVPAPTLSAPAPLALTTPAPTPPAPRPGARTYSGSRRRWRRWVPALLALVLVLLGVGAVVARLRPDMLTDLGLRTAATTSARYQRTNPPNWLPAGWTTIIDDESRASVVPGPATNGGACTSPVPGRLHVERHTFDVSGCVAADYVKALQLSDVAVEAELSIARGCAGMWVRTGTRGYLLATCADRTIRLHKLADDPAGRDNLLQQFTATFDPNKVVVGLMARGSTLTIRVDGVALRQVIDGDIASGRVGVGGLAPEDELDVTIIQFRAWAPPGSGT